MFPTRTLVVWCPDWPVAAAGIAADVRAAVFRANRVVACSTAARTEGVQRGLRRREAQARCPDLVVLEHDPARDGRAFEPVVAAVEAFAPRVEILRPGVCMVPTRGPSRYFGGDEALAAKVAAAVDAATGHACVTGIADGPFAATLAARAGRVVPLGESAAFLAPFPVRALDRPDLADILARLGIRTLGQFAGLGADDVLARFGTDGALAHRLARGLDERPLATRTPPPDLVVQRELEPPAQRVDTAAFVGKALADELHERLARLGLACTRVVIEAETEHGEQLRRVWRHEGALTSAAMAERVRWQLDGWLVRAAASEGQSDNPADDLGDVPDPTGGLILLRLVPDEVIPDDGRQLGFWGGGAEQGERAARALARVQGMLGPEAVVTAVASGGRSPGEQMTLVPWGDVREPARPPVESSERSSAAPAGPDEPGKPSATGEPEPDVRTPPPAARRRTRRRTRAATATATGDQPRSRRGRRRTPASETPAWPGHVPRPAPATVYPRPLPAEVHDAEGRAVQVTGRHVATARPARLSIDGGRWMEVAGWNGPWPIDERWWDPPAQRRRARFQVLTTAGAAYLLAVEKGTWWVEAAYD